jgi:hypothetical protein
VKPGRGATEFAQLPVEPEARLLEAVGRVIESESRYPSMGLGLVFRLLGSPRAWQLGGEEALRKLGDDQRCWLADAARGLLAKAEPGQKYFFCAEPPVFYGPSPRPERDLSGAEIIETWYFLDTMPIEFVERIAALTSKSQRGGF